MAYAAANDHQARKDLRTFTALTSPSSHAPSLAGSRLTSQFGSSEPLWKPSDLSS